MHHGREGSRGSSRKWVRYEQRAPSTCPLLPYSMSRMVNETDIVELELKSKRFNLSVKKKEALKSEQPLQVRWFSWCAFSMPLLLRGSIEWCMSASM